MLPKRVSAAEAAAAAAAAAAEAEARLPKPKAWQVKMLGFLKSETWNQRYTLCIMGILGFANLFTNRICLNTATEYITKPRHGKPAEFAWTEKEKGIAKSSFYIGYIVSHLPGGLMADRFGGKVVFMWGVVLTALTSLLTPIATKQIGLAGMVATRVVMGVAEGVTFPAGSCLLSKWTPPKERGVIGGLVMSGNQLGIIIGYVGTGLMLHYYDWGVAFYVWGLVALAFSMVFYFVCFSEPRMHPFISDREKTFLAETVVASSEHDHKVPWIPIITSLQVWTCILCQFGHDVGFFVMLTDLPKFLRDILTVSPQLNGVLSALPYMVMWPCSLFFCWLADYVITKEKMSRGLVRKIWTGVASLGPGAGMVIASYVHASVAATMFTLALCMGFMALYYAGVRINPLDLSPRHAGFVTALANGLGATAALIAPNVVSKIADPGTPSQWQLIYWITLGMMVIFGLPFILFASGDRQWWDSDEAVEEFNAKRRAKKEAKNAPPAPPGPPPKK